MKKNTEFGNVKSDRTWPWEWRGARRGWFSQRRRHVDSQAEIWWSTNVQPREYPSGVRTSQERESQTADSPRKGHHYTGRQTEVKVPHQPILCPREPTQEPSQGLNNASVFKHTGYHSAASVKMNSFTISFTKLRYIKILTGEHNAGKWEHPYTAVFQYKLSTYFFFQKQYCNTKKNPKRCLYSLA